MKKVLAIWLLVFAVFSFGQLDTSTVVDNQWIKILDENLPISQGNWVYENDFKADPNSSLFILGPGHVIHPQDCYYYPYDIFANKWYKNNSSARPTRQCLSSFVINEQDSMILQMAGAEMSHQLSQGGFSTDYRFISMEMRRGSGLWAYSLSRNNWAMMDGPTTLNPSAYSIYPQYDPVHDVMLSINGSQISVYSYHMNKSKTYSSPTSVGRFYYSTAVDTRRGLWYILVPGGLYRFNIDSGRGTRVADAGPGHPTGPGDGNGLGLTLMAYDEANDVMVYVYDGNTSQSPATDAETWIFKCDSLVWSKQIPIASPPDRGHLAYNKNLNLFMMLGGDAQGQTISRGGATKTSWIYRYKKSPTLKELLSPAPVVSITNTATSVTLNWLSVSDASGYNIYRAECTNGFPQNFIKLASAGGALTSYTDNSASPTTTYSYRVAAMHSATEGLLSRHCYTKPGIISDIAASVEDTSVVRVSWLQRPEADLAGYNVYRAKGSAIFGGAISGYYTKVNTVPIVSGEFFDTLKSPTDNLKDGVCRGYVVTVVNNKGEESGASPFATTFPNSPEWAYTMPTSGTFRLGWQPPRRTKILGVNLYRVHGTKLNSALIKDTVTLNWAWPPTTETDAYSIQGQTYLVRAVNMLGQEGYASDQISPSVSTFGFGIVPASTRFNYSRFAGVGVEQQVNAFIDRLNVDEASLFPNPYNPDVNVRIDVIKEQVVDISVIDMGGRVVKHKFLSAKPGRQSINFSFENEASGMYLFKIKANNKTYTRKAMYIR